MHLRRKNENRLGNFARNVGHVIVTRQTNIDGRLHMESNFCSCRTRVYDLADVWVAGDLRVNSDYGQINSGSVSITQIVQGGNVGNLTLHPSAHYSHMVEIIDPLVQVHHITIKLQILLRV